jgi:hypothetical protein
MDVPFDSHLIFFSFSLAEANQNADDDGDEEGEGNAEKRNGRNNFLPLFVLVVGELSVPRMIKTG